MLKAPFLLKCTSVPEAGLVPASCMAAGGERPGAGLCTNANCKPRLMWHMPKMWFIPFANFNIDWCKSIAKI